MALAQVEAAYGAARNTRNIATVDTHEAAQQRMVLERAAYDTVLSINDTQNERVLVRAREEARERAVIQMNMGAAMGLAGVAEVLFAEPLPPSNLWGEHVQQQYSHRGFSDRIRAHDSIGRRSRPSLPAALQINTTSDRLGPHGLVGLKPVSAPVICSYGQTVEQARAMASSAISSTINTAVAAGLRVVNVDAKPGNDDRHAAEEDGLRVWPPAAMKNAEDAAQTQETITDIINTFTSMGVKSNLLSAVPGVFTSVIEGALSSERLTILRQHRDAFMALGIGALKGRRVDVERAHSRICIYAAAAYALDYVALGTAFMELAKGPALDCAKQPWR